MMKKTIAAGTIALTLAGAGLALAQQATPREGRGLRPSAEDVAAFTDARIAGLKAGLKLTAEQEKNWPAVETAIRDLAKERADRMNEPPRREARARRRQRAAAPAGCHRAAAPGRRCHDHARGQPQEARRRRRAALQEPRRRPEAPLRHAAAHGRPARRRPRPLAAPRRQRPLRRPTNRPRRSFPPRRAPRARSRRACFRRLFLVLRAGRFSQMGRVAGQPGAALLQRRQLAGLSRIATRAHSSVGRAADS